MIPTCSALAKRLREDGGWGCDWARASWHAVDWKRTLSNVPMRCFIGGADHQLAGGAGEWPECANAGGAAGGDEC